MQGVEIYDLAGKIQQVTGPTGTYALAYDNMGRLIGATTTYSFLPGVPFTNSYVYDASHNECEASIRYRRSPSIWIVFLLVLFSSAAPGPGIYSRAVFPLKLSNESGGTTMPQGTFVAEREWARALARQVANQLPEAVRQVHDIRLTPAQIEELQRVFENTLVTNMGCEQRRP